MTGNEFHAVTNSLMSLKNLFKKFLPDPFIAAQKFIEVATHRQTVAGPFKGLKYPNGNNRGNALHAKYLGVYEKELDPVWGQLATRSFRTVIDIGACEGYLAVGSALLFSESTVLAFEQDEEERKAISILAKCNSVEDRIEARGYCDQNQLKAALEHAMAPVLVIVDIEGGEKDLIEPAQIPALRATTLLIETHDFKIPDCEQSIRRRFAATHNITSVPSRSRLKADLPWRIPPPFVKWFLNASSDFRSGNQVWLLLEPLSQKPERYSP